MPDSTSPQHQHTRISETGFEAILRSPMSQPLASKTVLLLIGAPPMAFAG
jgi:hypothetical protein